MKKKSCILLSLLVSSVCAIYFGVIAFSSNNVENINEHRKCLTLSEGNGLTLANWTPQDNGYVSSNEDPIIYMDSPVDSYVSNVKLVGALDDYENTVVKIYYTENEGEGFSEMSVIEAIPQRKNSDIYFSVERKVYYLRLDLYAQTGRSAEIREIQINPRSLNIHFSHFIVGFGVPLLLSSLLIFLVFYYEQIGGYFSGIKKYRYLLWDLVVKDIKTKYRRSILGVLWSVLNPLLMMLVLTAVFSNIFRFDIKDFPIYYLTGSLIFNFVSEATSFSLTAVLGASGLIKKVYIPKYIFPLEKCLFAFVNMLFAFVAVIIVFVILGITPHRSILLFPVPMIYSFTFSLGLGFVLSTLNVFFRDTGHLWGVFVTAWLYLTPIIYPMSILPEWMVGVVKFNPLYYYVEYFRNVMIYGIVPDLLDNMVCITFSGVMLLIGLVVFKRKQDKFILYI